MHHPTDRIAHTTAFVTPVVEHWLEWEIAQWVHHEGSIRWPIAPLPPHKKTTKNNNQIPPPIKNMASDIWLRTIPIVRKETRCRHIGYSFRLTARVLLYAPSHRQDSTYHGLCYTSRGALAGTRNSSMGPPHEGSIRWPIAPWANSLTTELQVGVWRLNVDLPSGL